MKQLETRAFIPIAAKMLVLKGIVPPEKHKMRDFIAKPLNKR